MGAISSQITSLTIVYSTVYSGAYKKKTPKLRVTGLCVWNSPGTGGFPAQMASYAENISIWWRHHEFVKAKTKRVAQLHIIFPCNRNPPVTMGQQCWLAINVITPYLSTVYVWVLVFVITYITSHFLCWKHMIKSIKHGNILNVFCESDWTKLKCAIN